MFLMLYSATAGSKSTDKAYDGGLRCLQHRIYGIIFSKKFCFETTAHAIFSTLFRGIDPPSEHAIKPLAHQPHPGDRRGKFGDRELYL